MHRSLNSEHNFRRPLFAILTAITVGGFCPVLVLSAQSAIVTTDTLRTSCGTIQPDARQCAVDRLARRVRARLGLADSLTWDVSRSAFVAGDLSVPARVQYVETGKEIAAVAMFEAPREKFIPTGLQSETTALSKERQVAPPPPAIAAAAPTATPVETQNVVVASSNLATASDEHVDAVNVAVDAGVALATVSSRPVDTFVDVTPAKVLASDASLNAIANALARYVPPRMAAPRVPPPPKSVLVVHGPGNSVPVIIGREKPVALRFALQDSVALRPGYDDDSATARPVTITKGSCKTGWFSPLDVADTRVEHDGTFICYIRFGESVSPDRAAKMEVTIEAGHRRVSQTITVTPVVAPTYSVQGSNGCQEVATRVRKMLEDRGVPVVSFRSAHRRADLTNCERFDRILPVSVGALNPAGVYLTGEITEAGVSVYSDATSVGPIELWTTKPAGDPTNELAEAIVARLLKYTGL